MTNRPVETTRSRVKSGVMVTALAVAGLLSIAPVLPARADPPPGWHNRDWREHEWRERERERFWRERHEVHPYAYVAPPTVYVPPPVYAPAPAPSFNLVVPIR